MKVYYNGLNVYKQFPSAENLVGNLIDSVYENLRDIEVSYCYTVLLVADVIYVQGAWNEKFQVDGTISRISCNEDKIVVLLTNGDLLKITNTIEKVPKLTNLDPDDQVIHISCGSKLVVALTKHGKLYNIPNKLDYENPDIIDVKTGREHCLLLDNKGNVYSFGRGSRGQLGHGCLDDEIEPKFIEALGGIKMKAIGVGGWHSCALSEEGDLYIWGWNGNGQLGLSNDESVSVMATPHVLDVDFNIRKVGCGTRHTIILSDAGILYGCGWNKYKQLNNVEEEILYTMTYLGDFSKEVIKSLKCGPWNTLILCDE